MNEAQKKAMCDDLLEAERRLEKAGLLYQETLPNGAKLANIDFAQIIEYVNQSRRAIEITDVDESEEPLDIEPYVIECYFCGGEFERPTPSKSKNPWCGECDREEEKHVCRDARVCEMIGCPGPPDDTPSLEPPPWAYK